MRVSKLISFAYVLCAFLTQLSARSPYENAQILYIRMKLLQQELLNNPNEPGAGQFNGPGCYPCLDEVGMLVRGLEDWDDRGDLDDDDRVEIHAHQEMLQEALRVFDALDIDESQNRPVLERFNAFLSNLEVAVRGSGWDEARIACARMLRALGFAMELPEPLERLLRLQERVRALRSIFDVVNRHYEHWVLATDDDGDDREGGLVEGGQRYRVDVVIDNEGENRSSLQTLVFVNMGLFPVVLEGGGEGCFFFN